MTNFKSAVCAVLFSSVAALALPTVAFAQDADAEDGSEDIVVSGLRQQYRGDVPLTDIPQSVQTLDGELLKDLNITRDQVAEFHVLPAPIAHGPAIEPESVLWWSAGGENWTPRIVVPIVVETVE